MAIVLSEIGEVRVAGAEVDGEELWLPAGELGAALGWTLREEGLCRRDVCVAIPPGREAEFTRDGTVNAAAFWRHTDRPVVHDRSGTVWVLGAASKERAAQLSSLEAPDFTLPDLDGELHSLREQRGKKVLLVTWASW